MGFLGTIVVLNVTVDVDAQQSDERRLTITCDESKATVAGWSYLSKFIIAGHEDGSVSQYDAKVCHSNICYFSKLDKALMTDGRPANSWTTSRPMKMACRSQTFKCPLTALIS